MDRKKDVIKIIVNESPEDQSEEIFEGQSNDANRSSVITTGYLITSCIICIAAAFLAAVLGYRTPVSESSVNKNIIALKQKDNDYIDARRNIDDLSQTNKELNSALSSKRAELQRFRRSQDSLDQITDNNDALEEEKASLTAEINRKQHTLSELESSANAISNKSFTLSSGDYTVGRDVSAGKFVISGSGSIAIARGGRSLVNKRLSSEGESFSLSENDLIRIDGNAKLMPDSG